MMESAVDLILASGSRARGALLRAAGIDFTQRSSDVDETAIKADMQMANASPDAIARQLACAKALSVAALFPEALTIGADQVLECEGHCFDKPVDRNAARDHLRTFRGRQHRLISAVVVARGNQIVWEHKADAILTMRHFTDVFLETYLDKAGPEILESVGAYRLEGIGAQLFEKIEGDYFTVLGLPLLALLGFLRSERPLSM